MFPIMKGHATPFIIVHNKIYRIFSGFSLLFFFKARTKEQFEITSSYPDNGMCHIPVINLQSLFQAGQ